jgi:hypothetical protein
MKTIVAYWDNAFDDRRLAGVYPLAGGLTGGAWRNQNHQYQNHHHHLQCFQISSCRSGHTTT